MSDLYKWYVVTVRPESEDKFVEWLGKATAGLNYYEEIFVPKQVKYSGYVFIKAALCDGLMKYISHNSYSFKLLTEPGGNIPKVITEEEIQNIKNAVYQKEESRDEVVPGDEVVILDDAFKNYSGVVSSMNEKNESACVEIMFFGTTMTVTFKLYQLKKIN